MNTKPTFPDVRQQFLQSWVVLQVAPDGLAHHGVLAHQHHGLPSEGHADLLHLLGAHVVCSHNEAFWVIIQKLDDLKEVVDTVVAVSFLDIVMVHQGLPHRV